MSEIEEEVLWACGEDYETPLTISTRVSHQTERELSESAARGVLLALADRGYVQAFLFDKATQQWKPLASSAAARDPSAWFMVTARGAHALDEEQDDGE